MRAPPRASYPSLLRSRFIVGRDANGRWVVRDRQGLIGGLFAGRASAVQFALEESDRIPGAVCCAPDDAVISASTAFETRLKNS